MRFMLKLRAGWILGGMLLLVGLGWVVRQETSGERPITHYELTAPLNQLAYSEVEAVLAPYMGRSFWTVELNKIQSELVRLDWVDQALVKRSWPNRLKISVQEQVPVARWSDTGLVNQKGEVFFPRNLQAFEQLASISGRIERSAELLRQLGAFQSLMNGLSWSIASLEEVSEGVWRIQVLDGPTVVVDSHHPMKKMQRFIAAYPAVKESFRKSAQVYDLRYSNGFAVKLAQGMDAKALDKNR
jgi:cell division protein FtsQ